ncbi:MAG: signal peptidase II [Isosphaeraceae bacterium]
MTLPRPHADLNPGSETMAEHPAPVCPSGRASVGAGRWVLFWVIAARRDGVRPDDQVGDLRADRPPGSRPVTVLPDVLELHTSYNPGALWGLGRSLPNSSLFFAGLSILAAFAICYWLFVRGAAADWRLTVALALIMAGALGNCYDRLILGHVRDFVHFHVDPIGFDCAIFNFADNMLIAGADPHAPRAPARNASRAGGRFEPRRPRAPPAPPRRNRHRPSSSAAIQTRRRASRRAMLVGTPGLPTPMASKRTAQQRAPAGRV